MGERARLAGLNLIGLDRRGFEKSDIQILMKVFKQLFLKKDGHFKDRLKQISDEYKSNETVSYMLDFCLEEHSRPLCQPKQ